MHMLQVLVLVLAEISLGTLLMGCLLPTKEIRLSFFMFLSVTGAVGMLGPVLLSHQVTWLPALLLSATAALLFRGEKAAAGRWSMIAATAAAWLLGLPMLASDLQSFGSVATGALLLGAAGVAMILGHWYLIMRQLSFGYLSRMILILLGAVVVRSGWLGLMMWWHAAEGLRPDTMFLLMRILWGLALPLALGLMALRCVKLRNNQAATGLLYLVVVGVLFGELFAAFLQV